MSAAITILGNTGRDVELRYTPQGQAVANFSIASNTVRGNGDAQTKKTDWFNVSAFGKQAETLAKYLTKGSQILVRGKLTFNPWLSRDGEARVSADVVLQDFEFAGGYPSRPATEAAEMETGNQANAHNANTANSDIDTSDEEAEMMAALHEMNVPNEEFANRF